MSVYITQNLDNFFRYDIILASLTSSSVGILTFRGLRFPPSEAGFMSIRIPTLLFVNSLTGSNVLKIQKPPVGGLLYLQGLSKELN